ncbi:replication protein RepA [Plantibacter sp. Mn2098]|uniref:replication protein RepA n=1 Tax=Plantibacter sp. Mn2098 TaxID=3395266 RepID=UPI003BEDA9D0
MANPVPAAAGASRASSSSLRISKSQVRLLNHLTAKELDPEFDSSEIAYSARVWAQVSLPYREPRDVPYWERRNGNVTLMVRPALLNDPETKTRREAYPYGIFPRHALTWMATEAVRTNSPELELGASMSAFMRKLGLTRGGKNAALMTEHMRRLFGAQLSVEGLAMGETGHGEVTEYWQIASRTQLWFPDRDEPENPGLWTSTVTLSPQFFQSIVDAPIPVDSDIMKMLGKSPLKLDQYLWLTYRMYYLTSPTRIKWADLNAQFGSQYARPRAFKDRFIQNLKELQVVYEGLHIEVTDTFLILRPSRTSVPSLSAYKGRRILRD